MEFVQIASTLSASHLRRHRDDDMWIDRLCHRYSVVLFSIFAILVTSKAYIGDPIGNPSVLLVSFRRVLHIMQPGHALKPGLDQIYIYIYNFDILFEVKPFSLREY